MSGRPVWLASLSRRPAGRAEAVSTQLWSKGTMADSIALLRRVLGPSGNPAYERVFRMQVTLCIHRALSDEELDALPFSFHASEATDLAGGPVEILEQTVDSGPSTKPCHLPTRAPLSRTDPLLWLPIDCHACPPCRARLKLDTAYDEKTARIPRYLDDTLRGVLR
jgi:hypothetical protein